MVFEIRAEIHLTNFVNMKKLGVVKSGVLGVHGVQSLYFTNITSCDKT